MSIRIKLLLTYVVLLIISAVVIFSSGIAIVAGIFHDVASTVISDQRIESVLPKAIDLLAELKQAEDYEPERLIDPNYIAEVSRQAAFYNGGLVVRYRDNTYNFGKLPKTNDFYDQLIVTESRGSRQGDSVNYQHSGDSSNIVKYDDKRYFYIDYPFVVKEEPVTYYFVADITKSRLSNGSGNMIFKVFAGLLLLMLVPLLVIVTQDIIKPIRQLERGVKEIKEGNLDFKMTSSQQNELGQVIRYFDAMREALKQSIDHQVAMEENRKELISSISHDLKTPITSIKGYVEGILEGVANTPEKQSNYLRVIHEKSKDLDALIDQLFLFSKLDLKQLPYHFTEVPLVAYLEDLVSEMRLGWESPEHQLVLTVDPSVAQLKIAIDAQHMKRVLVNLIHNSMRYMDKTPARIEVQASLEGEMVVLCVRDNGMGISEQDLEHIFTRFYRVDPSRNTQAGGSGLGLAIARQIVEHHNGTITASSTLGMGTQMCIRLRMDSTLQRERYEQDNA